MNFEKSEKAEHTEELLASRPQICRKQWNRGVYAKLIRPQLIKKEKTRVANFFLLEYSDPGTSNKYFMT